MIAAQLKTQEPIDIEKLLQWAYRDELSKRYTSAAEGIWDRISDIGQRGGIDPGHGAAQRYSHFGLPDPDALEIEKAVSALPDSILDWESEADLILGDLLSLVEPRGQEITQRRTTASWRGGSAALEPPRKTIMVRSLCTSALVTMHAKMGTRPDWRETAPQPGPVPAERGPNAKVVGECRGKNLYAQGSYCPVRWSPSPLSIAEVRSDYLAWWRGLKLLAETLSIDRFSPLSPNAPEMPWFQQERTVKLYRQRGVDSPSLPLKPARKLAGGRKANPRAGAVRYIDIGQSLD